MLLFLDKKLVFLAAIGLTTCLVHVRAQDNGSGDYSDYSSTDISTTDSSNISTWLGYSPYGPASLGSTPTSLTDAAATGSNYYSYSYSSYFTTGVWTTTTLTPSFTSSANATASFSIPYPNGHCPRPTPHQITTVQLQAPNRLVQSSVSSLPSSDLNYYPSYQPLVGGEVTIVDWCMFRVDEFYFRHYARDVYWFGASDLSLSNAKQISPNPVPAAPTPTSGAFLPNHYYSFTDFNVLILYSARDNEVLAVAQLRDASNWSENAGGRDLVTGSLLAAAVAGSLFALFL